MAINKEIKNLVAGHSDAIWNALDETMWDMADAIAEHLSDKSEEAKEMLMVELRKEVVRWAKEE